MPLVFTVVCVLEVIGGGLPVGAYGGKREIMEMVAPAGPMYQAGTLSGNPLAMVAGIETLSKLKDPEVYRHLDRVTGKLINGLLDRGAGGGPRNLWWAHQRDVRALLL